PYGPPGAPRSPLFPYTTLFRSEAGDLDCIHIDDGGVEGNLQLTQQGDVPGAAIFLIEAVIFHEPEPADIVRGAVAAGDRDATIRIRLGLAGDQGVEAHGTTVVEFAGHNDATRGLVTQVET